MNFSRFLVLGLLLCAAVSPAMAQQSIRLQFEILKDGSTVANPEVTIIAGSAGTIEVSDVARFQFTPTLRGPDGVALAFDIQAGGKRLEPRIVINKNEAGTLSWTSDPRAPSVTVRVSWIR